jgi:signal transduction histidine kinase
VSLVLTRESLGVGIPGAELAVADSGDGISPEAQKKIFERFYRKVVPLRGDAPNTGIGLALGQWIAEQHKSVLRVESALGKGARFSMILPLASRMPELGFLEHVSPATSPN